MCVQRGGVPVVCRAYLSQAHNAASSASSVEDTTTTVSLYYEYFAGSSGGIVPGVAELHQNVFGKAAEHARTRRPTQ